MRGTGISAAVAEVSESGKVSRSGKASTAASTAGSSDPSAVIYSIGDYRKFYVREAREKIRSSASTSKKQPQHTGQEDSSPVSSLTRLSEISLLSDGELLKTVSQLRGTEKKIEITMLLYLIEVERRGLDLSSGYKSLFYYCTRHLKYSESVASRRVRAARCMRDYPVVYEYLSAGKVNICNISEIAKIMTEKNHKSLLDQISGRSTRYVKTLVSSHQPATRIRDLVTPVKVFEKEYVKESRDENSLSTGSQGALVGLENPGGGQRFTTSAGGKNPCTLFGLSTDGGSKSEGEEETAATLKDRGPAEGSIRVREIQKFKLQFAVSPEFMTKYKRVKELMSTKHPGGIDFEGAFEALMDEYIEKHSPEARERRREARAAKKKMNPPAKVVKKKVNPAAKTEKTACAERASRTAGESCKVKKEKESASKTPSPVVPASAPTKGPEQPSRFIPQAIKDMVHRRDGEKCAYTAPDGQRCGSRWNLQVDHIIPFALGGSNSPENLQLLCRRHNQHKAIKDFGKKKIHSHSKRRF